MSRRPGRLMRQIDQLFRDEPDSAWRLGELCARLFDLPSREIEKRHRVNVRRAALAVVERLPGWQAVRGVSVGNPLVFLDRSNVRSFVLGRLKASYVGAYKSTGTLLQWIEQPGKHPNQQEQIARYRRYAERDGARARCTAGLVMNRMNKASVSGQVESPLTILFVEDEIDLRNLVQGMLYAKGFRVYAAADAIDALHTLHTKNVDLLFTDIVMPGIDGVQLVLRARRIRPGLKVLFMTGYVQRAIEREATRYGRVLFKPLRHSEILQEVEAVLGTAA